LPLTGSITKSMIKYLNSAKIKGKTVLLRADLDEEIMPGGSLEGDYRLRRLLPTIDYLRKQNCKVIICGHLGRPKGNWDAKFSLAPVALRLAELLNCKFIETDKILPDYPVDHLIFYKKNIQQEQAREQIKEIAGKDLVLLENLRYYEGEEANDAFFAKQLASLANVYVNDAFGNCHRAHASMVAITKYLPSYAGLTLEQEIKAFHYVLNRAKQPFMILMGGIKVSDKVATLNNLAKKADKILLGGGLANLFFAAAGLEVGQSKIEKEDTKLAWQIHKNFKDKIVLPQDVVVANQSHDKASIRAVLPHKIGKGDFVLDIGPKTILEFANSLRTARTVVWNGPLGLFEEKPFRTGTMALAKVIGGISQGQCYGVVGGGETVDAVRQAGQEEYFDHVSTGGGAMLEILAGNKLPGIEALDK